MNTDNTKPTHTPGPWRWVSNSEAHASDHDLDRLVGPLYDTNTPPWMGRQHEICNFGNAETYYPTEGMEPDDADKRLIAAAPDLLEALERLVNHGHDDECDFINYANGQCQCGITEAVAAIAKAKGTTQP